MRPFRLGLAGAGRMGRTHLAALADSGRVQIVAVADPAAASRNAVAAPGRAVFETIEAMLAAGGLDGVLVATPTDLHLPAIRLIAAAGLPILCEKPCGLTPAEAREAARIAAAAGVRLQVAYWRRFVPALRELRERIAGGAIGGLYFVTSAQWDGAPPGPEFRAGSGGIFVDMGVHEFDQIRWLTGQDIVSIHVEIPAVSADAPVPGDAESAQALCRLSGGSTALVSLGRRFPLGDVCWVEVHGTRGHENCRFLWPPDADAVFFAALRRQAEAFAAADNAGGAGAVNAGGACADDAIAALQAAALASAALTPINPAETSP